MSNARRLLLLTLAILAASALPGDCVYLPQPGPDRRALEPERKAVQHERSFEYALPLNPYELTEPELRRALDLAQEAGANSIVSGAVWWYMAPQHPPESHRLEPLDLLVRESKKRGMKVSLQISGTPDRVHPGLEATVPAHSSRIWHPPRGQRQIREFDDFVRFLVARYGTRIERYKVWNEPNSVDFWKPEPEPGEYAALLRKVYLGAKHVNPRVTIEFGGLSMNDIGFLTEYYEAARSYPDAPRHRYFFDVLNVHPYTPGQSPDWTDPKGLGSGANGALDRSFKGLSEMKSVMERNQDNQKSIFVGEFGYPTGSTEETWITPVPDYRRAFYLKRAYSLARQLPYVSGMNWYSYVPGSTVGEEWTILDANLNPSMTYRAFKQVTGAEGPGGVEVTIPVPREPASGTYLIHPALSGVDESDASGWELFVDGELAGYYDRAPLEWDTRRVENGAHSLVLAAYMRGGSVWSSAPVSLTVRNGAVSPSGAHR